MLHLCVDVVKSTCCRARDETCLARVLLLLIFIVVCFLLCYFLYKASLFIELCVVGWGERCEGKLLHFSKTRRSQTW